MTTTSVSPTYGPDLQASNLLNSNILKPPESYTVSVIVVKYARFIRKLRHTKYKLSKFKKTQKENEKQEAAACHDKEIQSFNS